MGGGVVGGGVVGGGVVGGGVVGGGVVGGGVVGGGVVGGGVVERGVVARGGDLCRWVLGAVVVVETVDRTWRGPAVTNVWVVVVVGPAAVRGAGMVDGVAPGGVARRG